MWPVITNGFGICYAGSPKKCIHTLKDYYMELKTQIYNIIGLFTYMKVINVQNDRVWLQCTSQIVHYFNKDIAAGIFNFLLNLF